MRATLNVCPQILVTHHVELVLPGANYLVRMLDGRIDTQGTIKDLRASGVLDDIAQVEEIEAHKEVQAVEAAKEVENPNSEIDGDTNGVLTGTVKEKKKPDVPPPLDHRYMVNVVTSTSLLLST